MIIINDSAKTLYKKAAKLIENTINSIEKENIVLAIPGGRSVPEIFKNLLTLNIPWDKVKIFMVDERLVPITDSVSNFKLAKDNFLDKLLRKKIISSNNLYPFMVDEGIEKYEQDLINLGGKFDIILLSSGEDGHVGALYPLHHSIYNDASFFLTMTDSPKPPPGRMTASRKLLQSASTAIILFLGEGKKKAYEKFNSTELSIEQCPAKLINNIPKSYVLTDL